ncbi:MAG TPA: MauE/DoxX family redox-associated membrane protein [Blastocatellia bacterium]|nr:MauE/DoxX family redox-associated membrane protein [Blastocatellia bacterium]
MQILKTVLKYLLAIFFIGAGVNHFINPEFYLRIMPPYLPWHGPLNYLSGLLEILFGAMLLIPKYTRLAAWGIIAVLLAVFPANIHMAMNPHLYPELPPAAYYIRLPIQGIFIAWAYWFTRPEARAVRRAYES